MEASEVLNVLWEYIKVIIDKRLISIAIQIVIHE